MLLTTTRALADRYGEAWNSNDVDAILALHAEGSAFHLHVEGFEEAVGNEAVRAQFESFLSAWRDLHFENVRVDAGEDFYVAEWRMSGTLATQLESGGYRSDAVGSRFEVDGLDVIRCRDGLVARKDTYVDSASLQRQVGAAAA
ncbi:MAG TPA: nuclear transport factor 2 family protein [Thermoleophilaceae bacterium]